MFALRTLRAQNSAAGILRRGNAVLQSATNGAAASPPPPPPSTKETTTASDATAKAPVADAEGADKTQGRRRRRKREPIPPKRPAVTGRVWNRPIAEGILPAYDLALSLIRKDASILGQEASRLLEEVQSLREKLKEVGGWESESEEARELKRVMAEKLERSRKLEIQAGVNQPNVRWRVANGLANIERPSNRHLLEQRWRKDGGLDLLMERLYQMSVIPDALPVLRPTIDVHVAARTTYKDMRLTGKKHSIVEPGSYLLPERTLEPPNVYATAFHESQRLYTLIMVDLDVPDEETQSFTTFLHWLKPNIPISALNIYDYTYRKIPNLNDHTPYIPPHPQRGTKYHRYTLFLLPQPPKEGWSYSLIEDWRLSMVDETSSQHLEIPPVADADRLGFNVREFANQWGLVLVEGGGAHLWREVWSPAVSKIYRNVLQQPEPRYGIRPKADRYAEVKRTKRYI